MADDKAQWIGEEPSVLVFDVNETLIDFESLGPLFERVFGDRRVLREWLGHLIMYSMTITLSGLYEEYFTLGQGLLQMVGDIHGVEVKPSDVEELRTGMLTMPAHPDVEPGLRQLKDAGFRLVTLTNSPPNPKGKSPLEHAGIASFFERQFTIDTVRAYKPAPQVYHMVAQDLGVPAFSCFMVAAHVWDTVGAQSNGYTAGLVTRPGNAPLPVRSLPQPNIVAPDLPALASELIRIWR
ncbi:haloacid dehalogenase type II [Actinoallomurus bryophytorum]|uniref:2-haloacid dehalogenase n=1 Tax=Actinoallomurus bryophytorum TaxID=1490222 RepID=A0A543CTN3_9ACTN|nr:haloacid dehalogenase type II [Actinoallomurus bryophytorum]TQM00399.1 2-haloacid dehalogenase [Actinoallomurus bryophytorum]